MVLAIRVVPAAGTESVDSVIASDDANAIALIGLEGRSYQPQRSAHTPDTKQQMAQSTARICFYRYSTVPIFNTYASYGFCGRCVIDVSSQRGWVVVSGDRECECGCECGDDGCADAMRPARRPEPAVDPYHDEGGRRSSTP